MRSPPTAIKKDLCRYIIGLRECVYRFFFAGFLVDFISGPVTAGFTSAAAFVIAMTQVKDLLGLNFVGANSFMEVWEQLSLHFHEISVGDAVLGFSCMFVLLSLRVSIRRAFVIFFYYVSRRCEALWRARAAPHPDVCARL